MTNALQPCTADMPVGRTADFPVGLARTAKRAPAYRRLPNLPYRRFSIGRSSRSRGRPVAERSAGWETRDTADWEVCGTHACTPARRGLRFCLTALAGQVGAQVPENREE